MRSVTYLDGSAELLFVIEEDRMDRGLLFGVVMDFATRTSFRNNAGLLNRKLQLYGIISAFQAGKVPSVSSSRDTLACQLDH